MIYNLRHASLSTCAMNKLFKPKRTVFADFKSIHSVLILKIRSQPEKLKISFLKFGTTGIYTFSVPGIPYPQS